MAFGEGFKDMSFDETTESLSKQGMGNYLEMLKAELLVKVGEELDKTQNMESIISSGWQGVSRDRFFAQFNKAIEQMKKDLVDEYYDLFYKLTELANNYYNQDANMLSD